MYDVQRGNDSVGLAGVANLMELSESDLLTADAAELTAAIDAVLSWHRETALASQSTQTDVKQLNTTHPLRTLYKNFMVNFGIMPTTLDRQDPILFFQILTEPDPETLDPAKQPKEIMELYGF
jgi:hypothetical protein